MSDYIKTNWTNDGGEPVSASNLNKIEAGIAEGFTQLEKITEGGSVGWRLKGADPNNYDSIGNHAVDLSFAEFDDGFGAGGNFSFAVGLNVYSGHYSHAEGEYTIATTYSHAEGIDTIAQLYSHAEGEYTFAENYSHAEGVETRASNYASHAEGDNTRTNNDCQHVGGKYNVGQLNTLFEIGGGTDHDNRLNVFEIHENGLVKAPELDLELIIDPKSLVTKEALDTKLTSSIANEPIGSIVVQNIVLISQADYDQAVIDLTLAVGTHYIIT